MIVAVVKMGHAYVDAAVAPAAPIAHSAPAAQLGTPALSAHGRTVQPAGDVGAVAFNVIVAPSTLEYSNSLGMLIVVAPYGNAADPAANFRQRIGHRISAARALPAT